MNRPPYNGVSRKLLLAFDIGTTYSGAAYTFLDPGRVPQTTSVTRYLDNPNTGSTKVSSVLYYDCDGNFKGVENGTGLADDESLLQIKWWKLLLAPTKLPPEMKKLLPKNLPKGKITIDLFSDFMRYLFDSTKTLLISSDQIGEQRWNSVSDEIELILTHPNGWGGPQQSQLRAAAIRAGIVPDTKEGRNRVHFVTEGEASFNFCATHTGAGETLERGNKVLVVDAGGGTIDISSYVVTGDTPLRVEELFQPASLLHGGEFVTARAREVVSEQLEGSKFNTPEDIATFAQNFDEHLKRGFSGGNGTHYVKFCSARDSDPQRGVKAGKLTLTGAQVAGFFEHSIQSAVDSITENFTEILPMNSFAFLVGGFASSPWLTDQLNQRLSNLGLKFFKPDTNTDKAVAVGAVSFYIDRFVKGRLSRFTYGFPYSVLHEGSSPEHVKRQHTTYLDPLGDRCIPRAFLIMLPKATKVFEDRVIRRQMYKVCKGSTEMTVSAEITKYDGDQEVPRWMDTDPKRFETLCCVSADISAAPYTQKFGTFGRLCHRREFDVVLLVGLTELKAEIRWRDSTTGVEESGDAIVVYDNEAENCAITNLTRRAAAPPRFVVKEMVFNVIFFIVFPVLCVAVAAASYLL